ncbi:redox-sensitive bicupin YhaK (pirin superfamily) [Parabacteroides sp. PF5-5]|uniref:pirin family protein n=1 Tax=unclassified Parabacteroides TaxID=2649774 RepID=UPI0024758E36|nr:MULTISPECIES: pirin family protein [unclassified Parabacteroides]MDH6305422.1 redox-sensitive bicupin YhaK (pirin superfamily) [Parabacteroides sp. PH5-39]MDH6316132.1 redox-sensitive bicupin YhaK (pirin superfamily) [Parabacteroides sp. PF5-13]MDH6320282.1 redox-sensitive bicupin YhaK (pirin superfamily) [Parabacteroides sp. PH5-13]MDH6324012.1 redox-sensitive bicupin YhaK (pirin superfamily) [Parabacteroides sp. PH5-8]MDH6327323.1 redox-sensitive bicupin YhaK (pirin superfamily) [Parabact
MKVVVDKANTRGYFNHGWLKTRHTFSFADYYNPKRMHFGMLRVLNDDIVAPSEGFGMHPHKNMEVISIPLEGYLRHGDSIKNSHTITPGDIQVMSTGTGIFHSEYNDSAEEDLKFLQIWVFPKKENTTPKYDNYDIRPTQKRNEISLIISPDGDAPASILQDAWFSMGTLDAGQTKEYKLHKKDSGIYLFVIEGEVKVGDTILSKRDGAGFSETNELNIETLKESTILLLEVPMH